MLSNSDKKNLLCIARKALSNETTKSDGLSPILKKPKACFVTLLDRDGNLRGCIGTLDADLPLFQAAAKYARLAAFHDPRFDPVVPEEVESLQVEMSVLDEAKTISDPHQIKLGSEGLWVEHGGHSGVLLAKVPVEWGWDINQFVEETCIKASLHPENWRDYLWSAFIEESFSEQHLTDK